MERGFLLGSWKNSLNPCFAPSQTASDVVPFPPSVGVYSQVWPPEPSLPLSLLWLLPMALVVQRFGGKGR